MLQEVWVSFQLTSLDPGEDSSEVFERHFCLKALRTFGGEITKKWWFILLAIWILYLVSVPLQIYLCNICQNTSPGIKRGIFFLLRMLSFALQPRGSFVYRCKSATLSLQFLLWWHELWTGKTGGQDQTIRRILEKW